jgi:hypothetical protein
MLCADEWLQLAIVGSLSGEVYDENCEKLYYYSIIIVNILGKERTSHTATHRYTEKREQGEGGN